MCIIIWIPLIGLLKICPVLFYSSRSFQFPSIGGNLIWSARSNRITPSIVSQVCTYVEEFPCEIDRHTGEMHRWKIPVDAPLNRVKWIRRRFSTLWAFFSFKGSTEERNKKGIGSTAIKRHFAFEGKTFRGQKGVWVFWGVIEPILYLVVWTGYSQVRQQYVDFSRWCFTDLFFSLWGKNVHRNIL